MATIRRMSGTTIEPFEGAPFGAELHVDLEGLHTAPERHELRRLLAVHQVLVVRGPVSAETHIELISAMGRILPQGPHIELHPPVSADAPKVTHLTNAEPQDIYSNAEFAFHHEFAYMPTPPLGLSLYAEKVAPDVAVTQFASGRLAFDGLDPAVQDRVCRLQALFVANYNFTKRNRDADVDPSWPRAVHSVAPIHPVSGDRTLFVNVSQTDRILGLSQGESDDLLGSLLDEIYRPEHRYDHHWMQSDLVIWDNLMLQHARPRNEPTAARSLRRIIFGEKTPWEEWPRHTDPTAARED